MNIQPGDLIENIGTKKYNIIGMYTAPSLWIVLRVDDFFAFEKTIHLKCMHIQGDCNFMSVGTIDTTSTSIANSYIKKNQWIIHKSTKNKI